jgi:adenylylsulfate kinase
MLIAMAGLPATGKSSLAVSLAGELDGVVLSKDEVRAALFPPPVLDYSREQDDLCMAAIYGAAAHTLRTIPGRAVILDGRTFLRSYQVQDLLALAASVGQAPHIIECVCANEVAKERLERDLERGDHPAANRTFALYLELRAAAEPITLRHLVLDTGKLSPGECLTRCVEFLRGCGSSGNVTSGSG